MDGWSDGVMCLLFLMIRLISGSTRCTDRMHCLARWMDGWMDGLMDGMDGMDGWVGGWIG